MCNIFKCIITTYCVYVQISDWSMIKSLMCKTGSCLGDYVGSRGAWDVVRAVRQIMGAELPIVVDDVRSIEHIVTVCQHYMTATFGHLFIEFFFFEFFSDIKRSNNLSWPLKLSSIHVRIQTVNKYGIGVFSSRNSNASKAFVLAARTQPFLVVVSYSADVARYLDVRSPAAIAFSHVRTPCITTHQWY